MATILFLGAIPSGLAGTISSVNGLFAVRFFIGQQSPAFGRCHLKLLHTGGSVSPFTRSRTERTRCCGLSIPHWLELSRGLDAGQPPRLRVSCNAPVLTMGSGIQRMKDADEDYLKPK